MGNTYFPHRKWDGTNHDPIRMLEELIEKNRDVIQISLNMEIIREAARENKCPMYDGRGNCGLYPELRLCSSKGKLTDNKCSFYRKTLDNLMETLKRNIQKY